MSLKNAYDPDESRADDCEPISTASEINTETNETEIENSERTAQCNEVHFETIIR